MNTVSITTSYIPGALGRIIELHGSYYARYWGLGLYFESKVAEELTEFLQRFDPARDGLWLAVQGDEKIVGAIAIDGRNLETLGARLRYFILAPEVQGLGVGKRLMEEAMRFCDRLPCKRAYLTTFAGLDSARHLYEKHGFHLCKEEEGNYWGQVTREQEFERFYNNRYVEELPTN